MLLYGEELAGKQGSGCARRTQDEATWWSEPGEARGRGEVWREADYGGLVPVTYF